MTQCVADDVVAKFARRQHDWLERVLKGSLDPEEVARTVQVLIDRGNKPNHTTITVVFGITLSERINLGKYDGVNSDISEKWFPHDTTTVGEWEFKLAHLNCDVFSEDAKRAVEVDGFTCAKVEHILAFGEAFPEEQRKFSIIALGSVCKVYGDRCVPELWHGDTSRSLRLNWWGGGWNSHTRFLVVRKNQNN